MVRSQVIRGATLSGYVQAAQDVGLDPYTMLRKAGLTCESLREPELLISYDSFLRLLELSAEASGHYDFGARASIARGIPDLGAVSLLLREAETVEVALQTILSRLHLHSDGIDICINERSTELFISFRIVASRGVGTVQATEFCACGLVLVIRWLIGADWKPRRVCFTHSGKRQTSIQRAFFQSAVRYEQSASGILIDRQTLQRPVNTSSPFLRRQAKRYLEETLATKPLNISSKVSELIVQMLSRGCCSVENVAMALGVDRRTLARRLECEGESYASLLQRARCELVQRITTDARISLTDAAEMAGFQSLSSFSRWFRATFGCSPTRWRRSGYQSFADGSRKTRTDADTEETMLERFDGLHPAMAGLPSRTAAGEHSG